MVDFSTCAGLVGGFSLASFGLGYVLGKVGIANIESDLSTIKGLVSGQNKVAVVSSPSQTPGVTTVSATDTVSTHS